MRPRYRFFRIPRRADALRDVLTRAAVEMTGCPACRRILRTTPRELGVMAVKVFPLPLSFLAIRTTWCRVCTRQSMYSFAPLMTVAKGREMRVFLDPCPSTSYRAVSFLDSPFDGDYSLGLHKHFVPVLRLMSRLSPASRRVLVLVDEGGLRIQKRGSPDLVVVHNNALVMVGDSLERYPLLSPYLGYKGRLAPSGIFERLAPLELSLVEDLLACASDEEAEARVVMYLLAE